MNSKEIVVRIINPSDKPHLPKADHPVHLKKKNMLLEKIINVIAGSGVGFVTGLLIYIMLKFFGINPGGIESSILVGIPALLGVVTSFVIY